ncbi:MAG: tyrosine-type recombinase/integrase [Gallionellaceae bacterium]
MRRQKYKTRITPPNHEHFPENHAGNPISTIPQRRDSLTTALPKGLNSGFEKPCRWAEQFHLKGEFLRVIATTFIWDKPHALRNILAQITSDNALALLEKWKQTEPAAELLYNLAVAAAGNSELLSFYRRAPAGTAAAKQLRGELRTHYLIALLAERLPILGPSEQSWFDQLRLWVLTHAISRSFSEIYQDNYLRVVAGKLRQACADSLEWRTVFLLLRPNAECPSFDSLNLLIVDQIDLLLQKIDPPILKDSHRSLLKILRSVAKEKHNKDLSRNASATPPFSLNDEYSRPGSRNYAPLLETVFEDEEVAFVSNDLDEDEENPDDHDYAQVGVNANQSYTHQELEGEAVFLSAAEELQFLPWSWGKPNPYELDALYNWVELNLSSKDEGNRVLAVVTWFAMQSALSLRRALDIKFSSELSGDWAIDPVSLALHCIPPQRLPGWRPRNGDQLRWVSPIADRLELPIPKSLKKILKNHLANHPSSQHLGDLWQASWGKNPEERFRDEVKKSFPRLTPGKLAGALAQKIFTVSGDPVLTRLLTSHPNSALSGACSYPGWNFSQLQPILSKIAFDVPFPTGSTGLSNVLGSRLDPVAPLLLEAIQSAIATVKRLAQQDDPIAFHNAYTAYIAVLLLAATGGRPIRDPFEKLEHFDFSRYFVFIDDKSSSDIHQGKLVILPQVICKYIQIDYLTHLQNFARAIQNVNSELSDDILGILLGKQTGRIPFLFFVEDGAYGWKTVSEKSIEDLGLFGWPIPLNLFRNRVSRKLRHMGGDPEVVDAIMGHAEGATPTHGDYSFRVWADDMQAIRPLMERLFNNLGFEMMPGWHGNSVCRVDPANPEQSPRSKANSIFGAAARKAERTRSKLLALLEAESQIKAYLEEHSLSELSELTKDGIDELSNVLLFKKSGLRHPRGHIKYQCLIKKLDKLWEEKGKKVRFKKRYIAMLEEASRFTEDAPGATDLFLELKAKLAEITPRLRGARLSHMVTADAALVYLCIENRITSNQLVEDILGRKHFRLTTLNGKAYLEHSRYIVEKVEDGPVQRYRLSANSANLLDTLSGAKISHSFKDHPVPEEIQPLADILVRRKKLGANSQILEFFNVLCRLVDQVNSMSMPGIVAGYLAGRVESYSLMWSDFARLSQGYAIQVPTTTDKEEANTADGSLPPAGTQPITFPPPGIDSTQLQLGAKSVLKEIDQLLAKYFAKRSGKYAAKDRADLKREMTWIINAHRTRISSAILLLALWICDLLHRKTSSGFLTISAIMRYVDALKYPFEEIAFHIELVSMDGDDVTLFYSNLIESLGVKNTQYVLDRLTDFHRWAKRTYAIEDPDWMDLPATFSTACVSPGIITEEDYRLALEILLSKPATNLREQLAPAFVLLLCYRFGLRAAEALALARDDWQVYGEMIVVFARNNSLRTLKRDTTRRQVPLLFALSKQERDIIGQWMLIADATSGNDMSEGLFFKDKREFTPSAIYRITSRAIASLKATTRNPRITLHHARHAAANRVGLGICGFDVKEWDSLSGSGNSDSRAMQTILLGSTGPTRRTIWALGGYLGHVRRGTTVRNYAHFISEIANSLIEPIGEEANASDLIHAISLDDFPRLPDMSPELLIPPAPFQPTPYLMLQFLRLVSMGKLADEAGHALGLDAIFSKRCFDFLSDIDKKMKLSKTKYIKAKADQSQFEFLRRITRIGWSRLLAFTKEIGKNKQNDTIPLPSLSLREISEMVGPTRQLLMWEPKHFQTVRYLLEKLKIDDSRYRVVYLENPASSIINMARSHGFNPISQSDASKERKGKFKIDSIMTGEYQYRVLKRCALTIVENDDFSIRNSIEFVAVISAFAVASLNLD